jgi:hypothetical protein
MPDVAAADLEIMSFTVVNIFTHKKSQNHFITNDKDFGFF